MNQDEIKKRIADEAVHFVSNDMVIGLGTGSTASYFIQSLAKRYRDEKLKIVTCATSRASAKLALSLGLPMKPIDEISRFDMTFDGADQVDKEKGLIKGLGGALLDEKIVAYASDELVILVDESKCVTHLGKMKLPVEVTPFGHKLTKSHIEALGFACSFRQGENGLFVTDNQNFLCDIELVTVYDDPQSLDLELKKIPGIVETGFFFNFAGRILVGRQDGKVDIL